jgi:hypothetical protein
MNSVIEAQIDRALYCSKSEKPTHVKPSFYAHCYQPLKEICFRYGYNLILHGSLHRDFDLIAIPWNKVIGSSDEMIKEVTEWLGGKLQEHWDYDNNQFRNHGILYNGRKTYVINLYRHDTTVRPYVDREFYLDISVTPAA